MCNNRNTDLTFGGSADDDCLDAGSQRYMYHQDANWRVVALTDESGAVVERYDYTAYGEPTILCGTAASAVESGNTLLVSAAPPDRRQLFARRVRMSAARTTLRCSPFNREPCSF